IDVKDARDRGAMRVEKRTDRGARPRAALRERAEASRIRPFRERAPLRSPFKEIPGHGLRDLERGLAGGVDCDLHRSGGISGVNLDMRGAQTETFEPAARRAS